MAGIAGYTGNVDWGTVVSDAGYKLNSWKLDFTADSLEDTDFDSNGWKTFLTGLKGWSGTIEAFVDDTNQLTIADVGTSATLKLYINDTKYFSGSAICTGVHPAVGVEGVETQTLDFQGTGELTFN